MQLFRRLRYIQPVATITDAIKDRISSLDLLISRLRESLASRPAGKLYFSSQRGKTRFYHSVSGKRRYYIGVDDKELLKKLSQKEYEQKRLEYALEEKSQLQKLLKTLPPSDPDIVLESIDERIRKYVKPDLSEDEAFARRWLDTEFEQHWKTEYHRIETLRKDLVISKSEALIADRLFSEGVPYRYEQILRLGRGFKQMVFYPDFTILNKRTRKLFYWEHLGILGDRNYCQDNLTKLDTYARYGIIQGKNLILTYESEGKTLSMAYVMKMIKEFLI